MPKGKKPKAKKVEVAYEITEYAMGVFSRTQTPDPKNIAMIVVYDEETERGHLNFYPNNVKLPNPHIEKDIIELFYHVDHFDVLSDMLRNEKPLYIEFNSPPPFGLIRSGKEPIGEEENLFYPRE